MKECSTCHEIWPIETYSRDPQTRDGRKSQCYGCTRERKWRMLGIKLNGQDVTWQDYCDLFPGQCQCCGTTDPGRQDWVIDHDHTTGEVRGVVCNRCNLNIGWYEANRVNVVSYLG